MLDEQLSTLENMLEQAINSNDPQRLTNLSLRYMRQAIQELRIIRKTTETQNLPPITLKDNFTDFDIVLVGDAGEFEPDYLDYPAQLLKCRYINGNRAGQEFYTWDFSLIGMNGVANVHLAMIAVPKLTLTSQQLNAAIREAE
jgi:hypothetical protein